MRTARRLRVRGLILAGACLSVLLSTSAIAQTAAPRTPASDSSGPGAVSPVAPAGAAAGRSLIDRQEIRAQLMPRRYTTLAAEIGARVRQIPVGEGGGFGEGDVLIAFDCSLQQAQLEKAKAEQEGAEHTQRANQRLMELNAIGQLELDLSRSALSRARAEVGASVALIEKCTVRAPFAGRVAEQKVREQQFVQPGQALLDILDDSVLELEFLVPSSWLSWLKPGHRLRVQIDETRKSYPARFTRIGARVDPVSQSVKVAAAIDGRFPELVSGMSGRVHAAAADNR